MVKKMKILFITNHFNPPRSTGSGNSSSLIYKELKNRGHKIKLLIFDYVSYEDDYKKTRFRENYRRRDLRSVIKELSQIRDGEYDIIHNYGGGFKRELLPLLCRKFKKTKIVTTLNGMWPACWSKNGKNYDKECSNCCKLPKKFYCAIEKRKNSMKWKSFLEYFYRHVQRILIRKYDKYFAQSKAIKVLFSKAGFDHSKIQNVPNFYDPELYEKIRKEKKKNNENVVVLYIGGLKGNKGVDKLIKAFKKIKQKKVELQIMGDGPQKRMLEKMSNEDKRIKFFGQIPYKSDKFVKNLKKADIFVHPGIWPEPFNRTILEAAISRTAIIASDIGAPPEVLGDKALIYDPHDIQGLVDCLKKLINNPEMRNKMREDIHDYILDEYSLESAIDKLEKEYERVINI